METPKFNKFINIDDFTEESKPLIVDYTCPLCKGIYYNPVIDMCGHIFCEKCFELHFQYKRICPVDNVPLDSTPTKVRPLSMVLEKQILKCRNREFGCEWNGPLKEFQDHISKDCQRQTVMCSWIGCSDYVFREDLPLHDKCCEYRVIKCDDCYLQLPFNQLKQHQDLCPKYKLSCPQECGENVERETIENHILNSCQNTIVQCPYMKYGCMDKVIKKDLISFLNDNRIKHETMTMNLIDKLVDRIDDLEHQLNTVKKITTISEQLNCLKSPISQFAKRKREESQSMLFEPNTNYKENQLMNIEKNSLIKGSDSTTSDEAKQQNCPSFDLVYIPKEIYVTGSKAKCISNKKKEHKYLFSALDISYEDKNTITSWSVTILQGEYWIGLGLCDKKRVIQNKMRFYSSSKNYNTGTFLVSSNGYSWNCNNDDENNKLIEGLKITEKKELFFCYNPKQNELTYRLDNNSGKLTKIFPLLGNTLTPCVVFLDVGGYINLRNLPVEPNN